MIEGSTRYDDDPAEVANFKAELRLFGRMFCC
jgi:hypothetical protein